MNEFNFPESEDIGPSTARGIKTDGDLGMALPHLRREVRVVMMTPADLKAARKALGLSAEGFARLVGVQSGRTVRRWERGDRDIPGTVERLLEALAEMGREQGEAFVRRLTGSTTANKPQGTAVYCAWPQKKAPRRVCGVSGRGPGAVLTTCYCKVT